MNEFRLILYVILLIVSIVSLISHQSKKSSNKKKGNEKLKSLTPERKLTAEELEIIRKEYKVKGEIFPDADVYSIEGEYDFTEISYRGGSIKTHFLDCFEIHWLPQFENIIKGKSKAEVVFTSKGTAFILKLNNDFSILKEADYVKELSGEGSSVNLDEEKVLTKLSRQMTDNELDFLNRDTRILAAISLFTSLLLPIISVNPGTLTFSAIFLLLSAYLYSRPMSQKIRTDNRLVKIVGDLKKAETDGFYRIGRFQLVMPKHWKIESGNRVEIEGYSTDAQGLLIKVLSMDNMYSIEREAAMSPIIKKSKLTLLSVVLVIISLLFLGPGKGVYNTVAANNILPTLSLKKDFKSFEEIQSTDFKESREVEFTNMSLLSRSENDVVNYYIVPDNISYDPDFSEIKKRIDRLAELQHTSFFIDLASLEIDDYYASVTFYNNQLSRMNDFEPIDFAETFSDNLSFQSVLEVWRNLDDDNYEVDISKLQRDLDNFYLKEVSLIKEHITNSVEFDITKSINVGSLYGLYLEEQNISINKNDILSYQESYSYDSELRHVDRLDVYDKLDKVESLYSAGGIRTDLRGIARTTEFSDGKNISIDFSYGAGYGDIYKYIVKSVLFILTLLLTLFILFKTIKIWNKR